MPAAQEFRDLEESMWRAETRFDRGYLERVLHPDFSEFGRSGRIWTRAETIGMESGEIDAVLPLSDFTVSQLGEDTVLVTYRSIVRHAELDYANRSSIWVRDGDAWRLRFHQGTPVHPD
jgi:ribonuclease HI